MAALARIAERHPRLKLPIDHLGRIGGGGGGTDAAAFADLGDMLALARYPNVAVKMSGAPSSSRQPYPYRERLVLADSREVKTTSFTRAEESRST